MKLDKQLSLRLRNMLIFFLILRYTVDQNELVFCIFLIVCTLMYPDSEEYISPCPSDTVQSP